MTLRPDVTDALRGLELAIAPPRPGTPVGNWRFTTRRRLSDLRAALLVEEVSGTGEESWLSARHNHVSKERGELLNRLAELTHGVLERADLESVRQDVRRLIADVQHHEQRLNDLAYDEVELELGGEQ